MKYIIICELKYEYAYKRYVFKVCNTFDEALGEVLDVINRLNTDSVSNEGYTGYYRKFNIIADDFDIYSSNVCASFNLNYKEHTDG